MSREDYTQDMRRALDRFEVPQLSKGFADRVMAAAHAPAGREPRDRRGAWRLARRAVIGTMAAGMVSAAAVASGLLGSAGIRVPVLTAMLEPEPALPLVTSVKPVRVAAAAPVKPPMAEAVSPPPPREISPALDRREQRRAERRAFLAKHPEVKPVVKKVFRQQRDFVSANPEVRQMRGMSRAERRAFLAERPELLTAIRANRDERRAVLAANPQVLALLKQRREERRAQRQGAVPPAAPEPSPPPE